MTKEYQDRIIFLCKCKDDELVVQGIKYMTKFFDYQWPAFTIKEQSGLVDAYCIGWTQGQDHILSLSTGIL